jgi:DNA-binding MarR family transcriptional regulator
VTGPNDHNSEPRISYLVARLDRLVRGNLAEALKPLGVSVPQYTLMSVLAHRPGLSNAQLARRSYISAQAMHQLVNTLEEKALIERSSSPDHGRIQMTTLTHAGRDVLDECDAAVGVVEERLFGPVGPEAEGDLRRIIEVIIGYDREIRSG